MSKIIRKKFIRSNVRWDQSIVDKTEVWAGVEFEGHISMEFMMRWYDIADGRRRILL